MLALQLVSCDTSCSRLLRQAFSNVRALLDFLAKASAAAVAAKVAVQLGSEKSVQSQYLHCSSCSLVRVCVRLVSTGSNAFLLVGLVEQSRQLLSQCENKACPGSRVGRRGGVGGGGGNTEQEESEMEKEEQDTHTTKEKEKQDTVTGVSVFLQRVCARSKHVCRFLQAQVCLSVSICARVCVCVCVYVCIDVRVGVGALGPALAYLI